MSWCRLRLAEERLVPFEATRHIAYADDRPGAFHDISPVGLTICRSAAGARGSVATDAPTTNHRGTSRGTFPLIDRLWLIPVSTKTTAGKAKLTPIFPIDSKAGKGHRAGTLEI